MNIPEKIDKFYDAEVMQAKDAHTLTFELVSKYNALIDYLHQQKIENPEVDELIGTSESKGTYYGGA